ncbi:unnamed protein product [Orchesella dallaii]|uniref:Protein kinase domain-containing protein n=1 Tax=Orchesella dallaii TaxID=48710 RepID=A0ABP1RXJ9_9HEXA
MYLNDGLKNDPTNQALQLYNILLTRVDGYDSLETALLETNQTLALAILRKKIVKTSQKETSCCLRGPKTTTKNDDALEVIVIGAKIQETSSGAAVFEGHFGARVCAVKKVPTGINSLKIHQELQVLEGCDTHKNIVRLFGHQKHQDYVLIALELCDMTLKEWVEDNALKRSIKISQTKVLRQITKGLEWLHEKKIVHRDLKPENILLTRKPEKVKISDFGLSKSLTNGRRFVSSSGTGTKGWIAPEILKGMVRGTLKNKFVSLINLKLFNKMLLCTNAPYAIL